MVRPRGEPSPSRVRPMPASVLFEAQAGDESASRALYRHYHGFVFAFLVRMLGGRRTEAEDLLQETFVRVFGALPRFDASGPASLSTWILTIAYRLALNELRRRRDIEPLSNLTLIDTQTPDLELRRIRLQRRLIDAIRALAPDHRAAFLLRDYHDLSYDEIAVVLRIEVGTVKSRLFRARRHVRAALKEQIDA